MTVTGRTTQPIRREARFAISEAGISFAVTDVRYLWTYVVKLIVGEKAAIA